MPTRASSNFLVNSRPTITERSGARSATASSNLIRRKGDSKSTTGTSHASAASKRLARAPGLGGRKPSKRKPDPPKPVAEDKPKDQPKPVEKKPEPPKVDPIAEALKSDQAKKPVPKQEAKATPPQPPKPKQERVFDQSKIAALLDKRDPTRQSITGAALNSSASLGTHAGNADAIVATWKGAFVAAVRRCFSFPYNGQDSDQFEVDIDIQLRPDGTVASAPAIIAVRGPSKSIGEAMAQSAKRAVEQCQAYTFLPKEQYDTWKYIPMTFGLKDML